MIQNWIGISALASIPAYEVDRTRVNQQAYPLAQEGLWSEAPEVDAVEESGCVEENHHGCHVTSEGNGLCGSLEEEQSG